MEKLKTLNLAKDSADFVLGNLKRLVRELVPLIVVAIITSGITLCAIGYMEEEEPEGLTPEQQEAHFQAITEKVSTVFMFKMPFDILFGVFALFFILAWLRIVVLGPETAKSPNPLKIRDYDWKFFGMLVLAVLLMVAVTFAGLYSIIFVPQYFDVLFAAVMFVDFVLALLLLKISFVAIARAAGDKVSMKEAWNLSKGRLWPIIGANIIFTLFFLLVVLVLSAPFELDMVEVEGAPLSYTIIIIMGIVFAIIYTLQVVAHLTTLGLAYKHARMTEPRPLSAP